MKKTSEMKFDSDKKFIADSIKYLKKLKRKKLLEELKSRTLLSRT